MLITFSMIQVPVDMICPTYDTQISKRQLNKLVKQLRADAALPKMIIVEKKESGNDFWLVAGYDNYLAYQKCGYKLVSCFCQPRTDEVFKRLEQLQWMYSGNSGWMDKHLKIADLMRKEKSISFIAEAIGVHVSDIKRYLIDPAIPEPIVKKALKNNSSFPLLNDIVRLDESWWIRNQLFERAVLPGRQPNNFTLDKMQKLKWLLKIKPFVRLVEDTERWSVIQLTVIHYKERLIDEMKKEVEKRL
ncbi:hypothetical protein ACFP7A_04950 [Sporolactobacillus kofuensis]|uniref:ParB/Sulfiredoxin domain-containing protein n=1 Tax=Sporolactobacillus kofuensis TaxID=269672 RepID=A0ABW1WCN6_9BACL|nr:hypothetical protein [Sporolactobacillus kofuensis]MCO7174807.1 hypothetical protein [Sporolactobacillus kofuensis]